ncbi:hypothetical protein [Streptomyces flavofungini]|uniref:Uncharacterized protein n=1 Tax=Streptomyces flavofungini TaxID=68200 RepID=A0ABS0XGG3_9ACTN|nr:hypothetical protein [Streptomyces flavofungini]MBJ3812317.1 hypothetical protein [Streptomyces flavofungini]GHC88494.1 hypothetical protein GCM10010349_75810 [Streptomyces flavofungini]
MTSRPKQDHNAADSPAAADRGRTQSAHLIKHTSSAKKGQDLAGPKELVRVARALQRYKLGSISHSTAVQAITRYDIGAVVGATFQNEESIKELRKRLTELQKSYDLLANPPRPLRPRITPVTIRRPSRNVGKPLIEQIKSPMSAEQAQAINERLEAADGPRRKLPPRP